jgi:hypothetical protein
MARQATARKTAPETETGFVSLDDYIDAAIAAIGGKHDADLDRALGHQGRAVCQWRTKRAWPDEDKMRRLAILSGADPQVAILQMKMWAAKTPEMVTLWRSLLGDRVKGAAVLMALFLGTTAPMAPAPAQAGTMPERNGHVTGGVYIMENDKRRRQRRSKAKEQPLAA